MFALLLFAAALASDAKEVRVTTLNGRDGSVGKLVDMSSGKVVLQTKDATIHFELSDVRYIEPVEDKAAPRTNRAPGEFGKRPAVWLETIDGSRIPGATYSVNKGSAELMLTTGATLKLSTKAIRLVEFPAADGAPSAWLGDVKSDQAGDLLVVRKRDGIDYVEG